MVNINSGRGCSRQDKQREADARLKRLLPSREEVFARYEKEPRILTPEFLKNIPWDLVRKHPVPMKFVQVLIYMRTVERLTEQYGLDMRSSGSGKDPHICRFLRRWEDEELEHANVLNEFLLHAGYPTDDRYYDKIISEVPTMKRIVRYGITPVLSALLGNSFKSVHMTFGALNEKSTLNSYAQLMKLANHPVLDIILNALIQEESRHMIFYYSTAEIQLTESVFSQKVARFVAEHWWQPVGMGDRGRDEMVHFVKTLYPSDEHVRKHIDIGLTAPIAKLPGFEGFNRPTKMGYQMLHE